MQGSYAQVIIYNFYVLLSYLIFLDTDPSDSIKVVNAVLTQIDQLKRFPNVLVFATSNMTDTVDIAFVDRADIKQYLGLPTSKAIYKIYHSCLCELIKVYFKLILSNM